MSTKIAYFFLKISLKFFSLIQIKITNNKKKLKPVILRILFFKGTTFFNFDLITN